MRIPKIPSREDKVPNEVSMPIYVKSAISVFCLGLFVVAWVMPGKIDIPMLTLLGVAVLPWLLQWVTVAGIDLRRAVASVEKDISQHEERLNTQQRLINDLVIYSLAAQPYEVLWRLANTSEYIYKNTENVRRWMNVLLDNGLIEPESRRRVVGL